MTEIPKDRILILDGAMGTMIRHVGCNDVMCLTHPDEIRAIHTAYLEAGADIISTNSFNANSFSLADYGMADRVTEINSAAAAIAREAADSFMKLHPDRQVYVAGSVGPTNKTASMSPDVSDPARRDVTYDMLRGTYRQQIAALVSNGADIILIETVFDTLNAKAALHAAEDVRAELGTDFGIMLSVTVTEKGARTFSGQTLEAFVASVAHAPLMSLGLNCSFGPEEMLPVLRQLAAISPFPVSAHPNAGLPDASGCYAESPERMAAAISRFVSEGLVNIVGGCCGTTPAHIRLFPAIVDGARPHTPVAPSPSSLRLSGLEALEICPGSTFINVGERCNVAGSRRFLRLIKEKNYDEALAIALRQVRDGANIIDINMDDPMLDAPAEMTRFLNLIASEPEIAAVPVMIDSSDWATVRAALEVVQGKSIVNSISLKEGEEKFLAKAREIHRYGAAMVVMAFDEKGQADTLRRRIEICERAYSLLVDKAAIPPSDIIFDPNVLTVATGIEAHDRYAIDFIESVRWIRNNLPHAKVSGGVSNLSFAFRGNNTLREAIHSVFLHHATATGMDMAILNPAAIPPVESIDPELRSLIDDVLLCRTDSGLAVERLLAFAAGMTPSAAPEKKPQADRALVPVATRLAEAIVSGSAEFLAPDIEEALSSMPDGATVINGPLMDGMRRVGTLFGDGKMFLPQVVKSARTMKKAVELLMPALSGAADSAASAGKIIFATVRGDVHDIGKNIAAIVLSCNNFEVIDLGVMVEPETIVEAARAHRPDFICLSGLITPSLSEMATVIEMLAREGLDIPVMVGGATTSELHTALKLAPLSHAPVIYAADASRNPLLAARYLNPATREEFIDSLNKEYSALRLQHEPASLLPFSEASARRLRLDWENYFPLAPAAGTEAVTLTLDPELLRPFINRRALLHAWNLSSDEAAAEASKLLSDAEELFNSLATEWPGFCKARFRIAEAVSDGDDLVIAGRRWPMLRSQRLIDGATLSLADFVMPVATGRTDFVGVFAVNGAFGLDELRESIKGDQYRAMLLSTLCDRIAEAGAELLHSLVRRNYWGYAADEALTVREIMQGRYTGIRPAVGFPSIPDQLMNRILDETIGLGEAGITLTDNGAMSPSASVSGLMIARPEARYFTVGRISDEQLDDYGRRRSISPSRLRRILSL